MTPEQEREGDDDFTRDLAGALVSFDEFGGILKISLLTDFSSACITGLVPGTTPETVVDILCGLGFDNLDVACVRIPRHTTSLETRATVKVANPLFARQLSAKLKNRDSVLSAIPIPINARRGNCRKVYMSWHKASRTVWVNFGNGEIANRVARKFNEGRYKCLGTLIKSSTGRQSLSRGRSSHNPVAWNITLSDVPSYATVEDVKGAIRLPEDKPRHIEMGSRSYEASNPEVSIEVRSQLEQHGPLESFYLAPTSHRKRVKATAWFQDEADARSACSLNNTPLEILGNGKLTIALVQSTKIKVSMEIYLASKSTIDEERTTWEKQHLAFHAYPDTSQRFMTLKVEGDNVKDVVSARRTLDEILNGIVLANGGKPVWAPALSSNGSAYRKLKSIEKELKVVMIRDKSNRQLRFYGPHKKSQQVVTRIQDMLKGEFFKSYEIDLEPEKFSQAIHGGFKSIEQALEKDIAVFNVILRKVTINGTQQQYETALAIMEGRGAVENHSKNPPRPQGDCPICFDEAETPIETSCHHTYCLECFKESCKSAASTSSSRGKFQVKCHGGEGTCATVFTLRELKDHLSSSVFETVLQSSFEEYIRRHPESFHYCPTPDCGYIYRCTSDSNPPAYTCPNCFEPLCTSCHARHGNHTCAEYEDIKSGGYEALEKLKKELNIKDCPRCKTSMEKTEGCNHMTCQGCRAHICWVCLAVFETPGPCYDHLGKTHGGIGLEQYLEFV